MVPLLLRREREKAKEEKIIFALSHIRQCAYACIFMLVYGDYTRITVSPNKGKIMGSQDFTSGIQI